MGMVRAAWTLMQCLVARRAARAAESLALRQQLGVLQRSVKRPKLRKRDRIFWVWRAKLLSGWRSAVAIVQPSTAVRWHRQGFKLYWRWKSRKKGDRPKVERELRDLIRRMSRQNPLWGAPRILSVLRLLGYDVAESTVAKYMIRPKKPPSPTWRPFLNDHVKQIAAIDFFTVRTVPFRIPAFDAWL